MQQKSLHIQEPQRSEKHRADGWNEKCSRAGVAKRCEGGEGKYAQVRRRANKSKGNIGEIRFGFDVLGSSNAFVFEFRVVAEIH